MTGKSGFKQVTKDSTRISNTQSILTGVILVNNEKNIAKPLVVQGKRPWTYGRTQDPGTTAKMGSKTQDSYRTQDPRLKIRNPENGNKDPRPRTFYRWDLKPRAVIFCGIWYPRIMI